MSVAYLNSRIDERAVLSAAVESMLDKCAEKGEEPSAEQRSQLAAWGDQIKTLDAEILQLRTALDANEKFVQTVDRVAEVRERQERRDYQSARAPEPEPEVRMADAFLASPEFTEYRMRGDGARFQVQDIFELEERTTLTTGNTVPPVQRWGGTPGPREVTPFLDLINRERVSTQSFDYVKWSDATGVAVVPEGTPKPEVNVVPTLATLSLDTYAGWVPVTRQALEDQPRLRGIVESKLRRNLARELEKAAVAALAAEGAVPGAETDLEGIRIAAASIEAAGYAPSAVAMNPIDAGRLDILTMGVTVAGPVGQSSLWGLRVVPVASLAPGVAYVADWAQALTWFDRGNTDIYVSDSHADYFIRNTFVILAESRAAFDVTEPPAAQPVTITQPIDPPLAASASKK